LSYIGTPPSNAFTSLLKQDFSTSATTGYTLDHAVNNANDIALFINFVRQEPTAGYAASGTSLVLTSATASSDDMYCVYLGQALQTVNPANASVGSSQLSPIAITGQTALTSVASDDTVLISDTSASGALKKMTRANFVSGIGGTNTPMFQANLSGNQSLNAGATTKISFNTETFDTAGAYNTSTYRFTPQTAGKYLIEVSLQFAAGGSQLLYCYAYIYKNGSSTKISQNDFQSNPANTHNATASYIIDMNGSSDYVEAYGHIYNAGTVGSTDGGAKQSVFKGYKIIE
jgi:hypothetical protein